MIPARWLLLAVLFHASIGPLYARGGGGGFRGGGDFGGGEFRGEGEIRDDAVDNAAFRQEVPRLDDDAAVVPREVPVVERTGDDNVAVVSPDGAADVRVRPEGDDTANVNVRTADGRDYDATVAGPDGYRNGYIWRNGEYVAVNCAPWVPYAAPFGVWAGWNIVTQPDYVQYPVYATYPVETAVEIALQKLGLYNGPIDGLAASCADAIGQYQTQNGLPVTGTISPELLAQLGIEANFQ